MATERLPMRKTLEILRLKWELQLSNRKAARSASVSPATVDQCLAARGVGRRDDVRASARDRRGRARGAALPGERGREHRAAG